MNHAIKEIEKHLHNIEVWLEPKEVPVAGTKWVRFNYGMHFYAQ